MAGDMLCIGEDDEAKNPGIVESRPEAAEVVFQGLLIG
jgi:hypothetical protein